MISRSTPGTASKVALRLDEAAALARLLPPTLGIDLRRRCRLFGSDPPRRMRGRWPVGRCTTPVAVVPLTAVVAMALVTTVVAIVIVVDVDDARTHPRPCMVVGQPVRARRDSRVVATAAAVVAILREVVNEAARDATCEPEGAEKRNVSHHTENAPDPERLTRPRFHS
jgi:hypothetical protein